MAYLLTSVPEARLGVSPEIPHGFEAVKAPLLSLVSHLPPAPAVHLPCSPTPPPLTVARDPLPARLLARGLPPPPQPGPSRTLLLERAPQTRRWQHCSPTECPLQPPITYRRRSLTWCSESPQEHVPLPFQLYLPPHSPGLNLCSGHCAPQSAPKFSPTPKFWL